MARAFRSVRADPLSFLVDVSARFGDLVSFPVPGAPALLVNDPADARHVLQTASRNWGKETVQYAAPARVTGPGLLASSEPNWIEHRRLAAPAFHHERLELRTHSDPGAIIRIVEDLPAPLGPRKPKASPRRTSTSMPLTASKSPSDLRSPRARIIASVATSTGTYTALGDCQSAPPTDEALRVLSRAVPGLAPTRRPGLSGRCPAAAHVRTAALPERAFSACMASS